MIALYILIGIAALWLCGLAFLRKVWFYRDPVVKPDRDEHGMIIAPASGQVVYIKQFEGGELYAEKLGEKIQLPEIVGFDQPEKRGWAMGIYMSPLDVHFNYCPLPGKVERIHRKTASVNLPMIDMWEYIRLVYLRKVVDLFARKYHLENERNTIILDCNDVKVAAVLIADKFVSKIHCFVEEGQKLGYSEKLGFIDRGSQVDLIVFSDDVDFEVSIGQQVYGGRTVVAKLKVANGVAK